jgi:uncharacterized protein involved in exopolysaccharide biosynthesis
MEARQRPPEFADARTMSATGAQVWRGRDVLDFHSLALALWAERWIIVSASILGALVALAAALLATPLYRAESVLAPSTAQRVSLGYAMGDLQPSLSAATNAGGVSVLARLGVDTSRAATEEAVAVLLSRELGDAFISDENLAPLFFDRSWANVFGRWTGSVDEPPTEQDAFEFFAKNVRRVIRDERTGFISLQITWRDPEVAAAWANDLVGRLNARLRERAIARANLSLQALEAALEVVTLTDAREALNTLVERQVNERLLASISDEYAFRIIDHALPPDKNDVVWPRTLLMLMVGTSVGFLVGLTLVMLAYVARGR